jgi:hypothetical protein
LIKFFRKSVKFDALNLNFQGMVICNDLPDQEREKNVALNKRGIENSNEVPAFEDLEWKTHLQ